MFRPVRLLKVVSVIMIIMGVIAMGAAVMMYLLSSNSGGMLEDLGLVSGRITLLASAISIASAFCWIMAGIFGVSGKSRRMALLFGILYSLFFAYNFLDNIIHNGVNVIYIPTYVINLVIFVVFWWGMYRSRT